jgi:hypothetical protein
MPILIRTVHVVCSTGLHAQQLFMSHVSLGAAGGLAYTAGALTGPLSVR